MYDTIIIGGGPAGVAAGIYAARKQLKTILIAEEIGGQSTVSEGIGNWIGQTNISGADLAKAFHEHLDAVRGDVVELALGSRVTALTRAENGGFTATTTSGTSYTATSVLIASGAGRRKLTVPGADTFEHKGVTYCASCDGPLFAGKDVAVIGGGNAGFETAAQLLAYAKSVTLLHRHDTFKADATTVEKVCAHPNMRVIKNAVPTKVFGEQFVTGLTYTDAAGAEHELPVSGIFVEIGVVPNTDFLGTLLELDPAKHIVIKDHRRQTTSVEGVWAAGDCTDQLYHQNNIAAGDGAKAIEDLYLWIKKQ